MQCKLRCIDFRSVSDPRRAFLPAFGVTGSASDMSGSTSNHSGAAWEKNIFFGNAAGGPENHSYY